MVVDVKITKVDPEVWRRIRIEAIRRDKTLGELLGVMIDTLETNPQKRDQAERGEPGKP